VICGYSHFRHTLVYRRSVQKLLQFCKLKANIVITYAVRAVFTAEVAIWSKMVAIRKKTRKFKFFLKTLLAALSLCVFSGCEDKATKASSPGMKKAIVCMSCHGTSGNGHGDSAPRLAGQYRDYLIESMNAYSDGRRKHDLMKSFVGGLSQQDIQDLADFYSNQKGL